MRLLEELRLAWDVNRQATAAASRAMLPARLRGFRGWCTVLGVSIAAVMVVDRLSGPLAALLAALALLQLGMAVHQFHVGYWTQRNRPFGSAARTTVLLWAVAMVPIVLLMAVMVPGMVLDPTIHRPPVAWLSGALAFWLLARLAGALVAERTARRPPA